MDDAAVELRWTGMQRWWAVCGLLLIAVSWRLWLPSSEFPQVALFAWAALAPTWLTYASSLGMLLCLATLTVVTRASAPRTVALYGFVLTWAVLVVLNQHRIQAWAYQFALLAIAFSLSKPSRGLAWMRGLAISIYIFSALGKLDYAFVHTVGQQFLLVISGWLQGLFGAGRLDALGGEFRTALALLFPLAELAVALLLAVPRVRPAGVVGAILLHASLLALLGPSGLNHESGVLLWNLFFLGQTIWLFAPLTFFLPSRTQAGARGEGERLSNGATATTSDPPPPSGPHESESRACVPASRCGSWTSPLSACQAGWRRMAWQSWFPAGVGEWLLLATLILPLFEPWGWWDHWPSWGLYSPRNSRVQLEVHRTAWDRLPPDVRKWGRGLEADPSDPFSGSWVQVDLSAWSLDRLQVPIYPQQRFQLAVAIDFLKRWDLDRSFRLQLLGMSDRWTGQRSTVTLNDLTEAQRATKRYRFNAMPNP